MRPTERHSLHFDFSHLDPGDSYTFHHSLTDIPLQQHSDETRAVARADIPLLRAIPDQHLTHYVETDLPSDAIVLLYVTKPRTIGARTFDHPIHMAIHIPRAGREAVRQDSIKSRGAAAATIHPKLARLGITPESFAGAVGDDSDPEFPTHITNFQDATDAAVALLFHHGNLINLNTDNGGKVPAIIVEQCITPAVKATSGLPIAILEAKDNWLQTTQLHGPPPTSSITPTAAIMTEAKGPLQKALLLSQNNLDLKGQQWNPKYGIASSSYGGSSQGIPKSELAMPAAPETLGEVMLATQDSNGESWVPTNLTDTDGLSIDPSSVSYTPPPSTPTWTAQGVWSLNDVAPFSPLTSDIVAAINAGNVYLQISTTAQPQGLIRGQLVVGTFDPDTGLLSLSATLSGAEVVPAVSTTASGTATLTLNSGGTGLTYNISISMDNATDEPTAAFFVGASGTNAASPARDITVTDTTTNGTLTIQCTNKWLRHLSACVQYLDVGGNVLTPQGVSDRVPSFLRSAFEPDPNTRFLELVPPVNTVFGVPVPASATTISIPVWEEVHTVRLMFGGLGRGPYNSAVCPIGITVTALAELALPVFLLVAGTAVTNSKTVTSLMADKEVLFAVCAAGAFLAGGAGAAAIGTAQDPGAAAEGLAEKFGPMLLSPLTSLGKWVAEKMVEGAAGRATPFVDIALAVINGAVTAAELTETIVEVLESPFVFETDLSRSIELQIQLVPDPNYNKFPDYHSYLRVVVMYDVASTQPVLSLNLPSVTLSDPITVTFTAIPAGGNLRVYAFFYAPNGWQSGQGVSDWVPATSSSGPLQINNLVINTNKIPLSSNSVYIHNEKIGMVADAGPPATNQIGWIPAVGTPPTATVVTPSPFAGQNKALIRLSGITIAQEPEMIGYSWQATGLDVPPDSPSNPLSNDALWTLQNLSVLQDPQKGFAVPDVGFTEQPGIAYNIASADGSPTNFFVDSSVGEFDPVNNPAGGYHVRGVSLAHAGPPPSLQTNTNQSYGRFPAAMDRYVYHPQGYLFGINNAAHKLFRLKLTDAPGADANAPMAVLSSGQGQRDGLMFGPVGIAVALDGRILILESDNQRVQAFDIYGNAVPYFKNPGYNPNDPSSQNSVPTLALFSRDNSTYLDISVESQGYIYILSYTGDGSDPSMYQVDLYQADGTFLVTTPNVAAAKIVVDILRSLYALNYETFLDANGRPQPSVSMWLPPAPPPQEAKS